MDWLNLLLQRFVRQSIFQILVPDRVTWETRSSDWRELGQIAFCSFIPFRLIPEEKLNGPGFETELNYTLKMPLMTWMP